jgi:hypothetical protein
MLGKAIKLSKAHRLGVWQSTTAENLAPKKHCPEIYIFHKIQENPLSKKKFKSTILIVT